MAQFKKILEETLNTMSKQEFKEFVDEYVKESLNQGLEGDWTPQQLKNVAKRFVKEVLNTTKTGIINVGVLKDQIKRFPKQDSEIVKDIVLAFQHWK